ncbi:MAG: esterase/lipase family protein [Alphaproteobacteria bacterium]
MIVVFVHGWSVTDTDTYGRLPEALVAEAGKVGLGIDVQHVWLGRYVSFNDDVKMADVVIGFEKALREVLPWENNGALSEFSCITHSTGGPVVREWVEAYYGAGRLNELPLRHLVMLAPANHGSALAVIGKERIGRIKALFEGVEPGKKILEWLSLGSADQWRLSRSFLKYRQNGSRFFPFVLTGQTIDRHFYDFLNPYLKEIGSDGVVRVACANMNYCMLTLAETDDVVVNTHFPSRSANVLHLVGEKGRRLIDDKGQPLVGSDGHSLLDADCRPDPVALGVISRASHSGDDIGIMKSVKVENVADKPVVGEILRCLKVTSWGEYGTRRAELQTSTIQNQASDNESRTHRYMNLVFRVVDDQNNPVNDFDLYLLAGSDFDPDKLPEGFFVDRQRNVETPNCLVYYMDYDIMAGIKDGKFGLRLVARPDKGFARYKPVELRTEGKVLAGVLQPNQTTYVEIVLKRRVDENVFRLDPETQPRRDFSGISPATP